MVPARSPHAAVPAVRPRGQAGDGAGRALVALTVGFATVAFVRVLGLTILGADRPRGRRLPRLPDTGVAGRVGLFALAGSCVAVAAITPLEIRYLADGLAPVVPAHVTLGALGSPWVLQPVYPEFSVLSPSWLWVTMPLLLALVAGFVLLVARPAMTRVRLVPPWRSATGGVAGEDRYTAFGYANPTRRVLASVLLTRSEIREVERDEGAEEGPGLRYRSDVVELVGAYLYRPLLRPLQAIRAGREGCSRAGSTPTSPTCSSPSSAPSP